MPAGVAAEAHGYLAYGGAGPLHAGVFSRELGVQKVIVPQRETASTWCAFGVAIGGTISERVHVNVDYDQAREFDAANNINVYYQGLADEVLQQGVRSITDLMVMPGLINIHSHPGHEPAYRGIREEHGVLPTEEQLAVLLETAFFATLTDEQVQTMLRCEHGGMNEVLADVSVITGDTKVMGRGEIDGIVIDHA